MTASVPSIAHAQQQPQQQAPASREQREETKEDINPTSRLLWLDAEGGVQNASLSTFSQDFRRFSVGFIPKSGTGPALGAAVGVRFVFLTLGVRGRVARFENSDRSQAVDGWTMSSINGEIGMRAPLRRLEPHLTLSGGYTTFGGFGQAIQGISNAMNVNGLNVRAGLGFDYFLAKNFSVGALGSFEVLALSRPGIPVRSVLALPQSKTLDEAAVRFLAANGSSFGMALALTGGLKMHF